MKKLLLSYLLMVPCFCVAAVTVAVHKTANSQKSFGKITFQDTTHGLLIKPRLKGLQPGLHGLHIHTVPSCKNKGLAAKGHLDPGKTGQHKGPYATGGHLGDLPVLTVNAQGVANVPTLAPRLKVKDIKNHTIMLHAGGDNYSDHPKKLGGGDGRIGCGVIR